MSFIYLYFECQAHFYEVYLEGQRSLVGKAISKLDSLLVSIMNDKNGTHVDSTKAGGVSLV